MNPVVTLETKCWEKDWRAVLTPRWLETLATWNYAMDAPLRVIVNNIDDRREVEQRIDVVRKVFDFEPIFVEDHEAEAFEFFGVTRESLGAGYVYSAAEFVGIFTCKTPYLLHYASNCLPMEICNWIPRVLHLFDADHRINVANLTWNNKHWEAASESFEETRDFWIGYGFSDQSYLVRMSDFRAPIYNETHPSGSAYPTYGGELFEKRVNAYMRNHGWLRATYKHGSYWHER